MIQTFLDFGDESSAVEETVAPEVLIERFSHSCQECSLGFKCPKNPGLVYRGATSAKVALLGDGPDAIDIQNKTPFTGVHISGEIYRWLKHVGMKYEDLFLLLCFQCSDKRFNAGEDKFFNLLKNDVTHCFRTRALPLMRSLPNLEVVITVGMNAAQLLLGGDPGIKTHEGEWFGTDLLPGVAVFCLDHPRNIEACVGTKRGKTMQALDSFRNLYWKQDIITPTLQYTQKERAKGEIDLNFDLNLSK